MHSFRLTEDHRNRLYILGIISVLLIVWEVATREKFINAFYASQPTVIASDFFHFVTSGEILPHLLTTLQEAIFGLFFGIIAGVICGVALGKTKRLADLFEPIITALYGIPKLALAPIFILWFGLGMESKIFLSALLVFYLVFFSTYSGIRNINPDIIATVQLMGASQRQIFFKVTLPSCIPWVLTGIRGGIGASLIGAIVGEYMGASAGLGWMIQYATTTYQIERVMSCILALLLIGLFLNKGLRMCEKRLLRWRPDNY